MTDTEPRDFIRKIIQDDLESGKHDEIVTRFPPEHNGYVHIGHVMSICLNFGVAAETVEGNPPGPQTVIIKFESTEKAKAWYNSDAYQAIVGTRLAATEGFAVLSQAMNVGG